MIRPYKQTDKKDLIEILRLNTPHYFSPSEEQDFISYLENELEDYFVIEVNGKVLGSGGINYLDDTARISWDLIDPSNQGEGYGKALLQHRIEHIKKNPSIRNIVVRTSQFAYQFYGKSGFELIDKKKDFWAPGFDLYEMVLSTNH